jgi:DinB superfamily
MSINEIINTASQTFTSFSDRCNAIPETAFFFQPAEKWSIAQNVDHLIRSMKPTNLAFTIPKFIVRIVGGKPNRSSRSYDELVAKYKLKLEQGGRASGRFIPQPITGTTKEALLNHWQKITATFLQLLEKKWKDEQLDQYLIPHPLLGKITMREFCYFTIYHTQHHAQAIEERLTEIK